MTLTEHIIEILRGMVDVSDINPNSSLQDDLGLDSMMMVSLLLELEDAFYIVLEESDMNPFDLEYVSDVVALVAKYEGGEDNE